MRDSNTSRFFHIVARRLFTFIFLLIRRKLLFKQFFFSKVHIIINRATKTSANNDLISSRGSKPPFTFLVAVHTL